jgi:hypothetical protein
MEGTVGEMYVNGEVYMLDHHDENLTIYDSELEEVKDFSNVETFCINNEENLIVFTVKRDPEEFEDDE